MSNTMNQILIGKYIQQKRKEKGYTQQELADILHVSNKAVSKWETGVNMPEISLLEPLSEILGISVSELLNGKDFDESSGDTVKQCNHLLIDYFETVKTKYRNVIVILTLFIGIMVGILGYREIHEYRFLNQFKTLKKGYSYDDVLTSTNNSSIIFKDESHVSYVTPKGNIVEAVFNNKQTDSSLICVNEYDSKRTKCLRSILPVYSGEYRLRDDGSVKISFNKGKYSITGSGHDYEYIINYLTKTEGVFSNMFVYDYEESYSYYLNMFLDKDDHSTVINYLNSKEFYLSIGIHNYYFHQYDN